MESAIAPNLRARPLQLNAGVDSSSVQVSQPVKATRIRTPDLQAAACGPARLSKESFKLFSRITSNQSPDEALDLRLISSWSLNIPY